MMNLPDAHTHPVPAIPGAGPRFICGTCPADWEQAALLAEGDENVTPFFGIHPWRLNPDTWQEEMRLLESFLSRFPRAGIGETGLDKCRRGIPGLPVQKEALKQHLELAVRLNRPAALHCCRAWGTLAGILAEFPALKAVLHGWTGALNPAAQLPSGNWLLSVGLREMERPGILSSIPRQRLALESDEHPEALPELYRRAAQALSMKEEELAALVADNMEKVSAR
ncbi:TatD family hydrolase [uncultured Akkermansia sp.]|uniref:TatD family hydrolase n=1 Tax=uncultured Akkermansia sp. TaxID=512294 RepID=UPI0025EDD316|nr:TatD family hydrolase [uncultured Akkermansia sp.]